MEAPVEVGRRGEIAEVVLNRPEAYNALNAELVVQLCDHLTALATDDGVKGIVLTGRGKAFCSGGDLKWAAHSTRGVSSSFHSLAARFHLAVVEIRRMSKPVVAAINGVAAGAGFSLALACDFRVMARSAVLKQAYTSSGLSIDGGGTFTLPRMVGLARAMEIAAFDHPISAEQALSWGLVTHIAEDGKAVDAAMEMLKELTGKSLNSFGWSKRLLNDAFNNSLETQLELEREGIARCAAHPDGREGVAAFLEKRKPVFEK
ncbi:enoyl-CoA hydratase/isomerase family protein [Desulfoferrobacter suflitae]|uniref:enoyl-CoA hydratase/isomerase family protein n=1 Tax=Desulfoferrobacter suflitae TaxID=2865782 RepID=UPI0021645B78|nr:enoyl-CoA hydratase-related protein [Desulfoferrobacter suflitae]MCK8601611.1 enoyl-CoA hydratase-related protein [Desulfoferrobacter suflitae]